MNVTYDALDQLSGEVLPERVVLSTVAPVQFGGGAAGGPVVIDNNNAGGGAVVSACQATYSPGTPGLLGSLGLGSENPGSTLTCVPAAATY